MVDTSDLTTFESVSTSILKSDAEDALTREVFDPIGDFSKEGKLGISSASRRVKDYLTRELIVDKQLIFLARRDWREPDRIPNQDYTYRLAYPRIRDWPVHSTKQDTVIIGERKVFSPTRNLDQIEYIAGYRREDQTLTDFPQYIQDEFDNESDIPVLPATITDVVNNIAVHNAVLKISGLIGKSVSEQQVGDFNTTVRREQARSEYPKQQLKRIQSHRLFT